MLNFVIRNAGRSAVEKTAFTAMVANLLMEGTRPNEPISVVPLDKPFDTCAYDVLTSAVTGLDWPMRFADVKNSTEKDGKTVPAYVELTEAQALRYRYSAGFAVRHGCTRAAALLALAAAGQELPVYTATARDDADGLTVDGIRQNVPTGKRADPLAILTQCVKICRDVGEMRERTLLPLFGGLPGCKGNQQRYLPLVKLASLPDAPPLADLLAMPGAVVKELAAREEATLALRMRGAEKSAPVVEDPATVAAKLADKKSALLAHLASMDAADLRAVLAAMVAGMDAGAVETLAKLAGMTPPAAPTGPAALEPAAPAPVDKKHAKK